MALIDMCAQDAETGISSALHNYSLIGCKLISERLNLTSNDGQQLIVAASAHSVFTDCCIRWVLASGCSSNRAADKWNKHISAAIKKKH